MPGSPPGGTTVTMADNPFRMSFVGNSYTYYNHLPLQLEAMLRAAAWPVAPPRSVTVGGRQLDQASRDPAVAQLLSEPCDLLVLQDHSCVPGGADADRLLASRDALRSFFAPAARRVVADGGRPLKVLVFGSWGHRHGCRVYQAMRLAYPSFTSMASQTAAGCRAYTRILQDQLADEARATVALAPVGRAFHLSMSEGSP